MVHHTHTNILGNDRDIGYSLPRMTPEQRWKPRHLLQPLADLMLALGFQYGVGSHDLEVAPEVQVLCCVRPTLRYNTGGLFKQSASVMKRIWANTWPSAPVLAMSIKG